MAGLNAARRVRDVIHLSPLSVLLSNWDILESYQLYVSPSSLQWPEAHNIELCRLLEELHNILISLDDLPHQEHLQELDLLQHRLDSLLVDLKVHISLFNGGRR